MRVPEEVGAGLVKITLSYPDWTECDVKPLTLKMPLRDAKPEHATTGRISTSTGDIPK